MISEREWTRLASYFAGECTPDEAEGIRRRLEADAEFRRLADDLRPVWQAAAIPGTAWDTPESWQRLAARMRARERRAPIAVLRPAARGRWVRVKRRWVASVAAAAVVLAAGGLGLGAAGVRLPSFLVTTAQREVRTGPTQRLAFQLVDGSRIVLAPGSVLRYDPVHFRSTARDIYLEGRAYFEVAHDARRPFFVRTARTITEDLGTGFTIRDYAGEAAAEVAVVSGTVAVRSPATGRARPATVLVRGELVQLDDGGRAIVRRGFDFGSRLAWTEGRLVFAETPVRDVVAELGRWYGLDLRLGSPALGEQRFTASYTTQPDSVVLRELAAAIGARMTRAGAVVTLYPSENRP